MFVIGVEKELGEGKEIMAVYFNGKKMAVIGDSGNGKFTRRDLFS